MWFGLGVRGLICRKEWGMGFRNGRGRLMRVTVSLGEGNDVGYLGSGNRAVDEVMGDVGTYSGRSRKV